MKRYGKRIIETLVLVCALLLAALTAAAPGQAADIPIRQIDPITLQPRGEARALVIVCDFADVKYRSDRISDEELERDLFGTGTADLYPYVCLTMYFENASYGALHMDGDVYHYTLSGNIADYENSDQDFEKFVTEVLNGLDDTIDYRKYDADRDGYIDVLSMSIPTGGDAEFWYGCTATWESDPLKLDGEKLWHYVINDEQPYADTLDYYLGTLAHEYGHCMGLSDYYEYGKDEDWQATTGDAGLERMDESEGDFCPYSKLMVGWYGKENIQCYDWAKGGTQVFTLKDDSTDPSVLLLPSAESCDLFSEYFTVDYITPRANFATLFDEGGVRLYHVDSELGTYDDGTDYLLYDGFSPDYDSTGKGRRLIRLVNNGKGFYTEGDTIDCSASGFAWYDESGKETVDTGYTVHVDSIDETARTCTVSVTRK